MNNLKKLTLILCALTASPMLGSAAPTRSKSAPAPSPVQPLQQLSRQSRWALGNQYQQQATPHNQSIESNQSSASSGKTPKPKSTHLQPTQPRQSLSPQARNALGNQHLTDSKKASNPSTISRVEIDQNITPQKATQSSAFGASVSPSQARETRPTDYSTHNVGVVPEIKFTQQLPRLPFHRVRSAQGPLAPRNNSEARHYHSDNDDHDNDNDRQPSPEPQNPQDPDDFQARNLFHDYRPAAAAQSSPHNPGLGLHEESDQHEKSSDSDNEIPHSLPNPRKRTWRELALRQLADCTIADSTDALPSTRSNNTEESSNDGDNDEEGPTQPTPRRSGESARQAARRRLADYKIADSNEKLPEQPLEIHSQPSEKLSELYNKDQSPQRATKAKSFDATAPLDLPTTSKRVPSHIASQELHHVPDTSTLEPRDHHDPASTTSDQAALATQPNRRMPAHQNKPQNLDLDTQSTPAVDIHCQIPAVNTHHNPRPFAFFTTQDVVNAKNDPEQNATHAQKTYTSNPASIAQQNEEQEHDDTGSTVSAATYVTMAAAAGATYHNHATRSHKSADSQNHTESSGNPKTSQTVSQAVPINFAQKLLTPNKNVLTTENSLITIDSPQRHDTVEQFDTITQPPKQLPTMTLFDYALHAKQAANSLINMHDHHAAPAVYGQNQLMYQTLHTPTTPHVHHENVEILSPLLSHATPELEPSPITFDAEFEPHKELSSSQQAQTDSLPAYPLTAIANSVEKEPKPQIALPKAPQVPLLTQSAAKQSTTEMTSLQAASAQPEVATPLLTSQFNPFLALENQRQFLFSYAQVACAAAATPLAAAKITTPLITPTKVAPFLLRTFLTKTKMGIACTVIGGAGTYYYKKYYNPNSPDQESPTQETSQETTQEVLQNDAMHVATLAHANENPPKQNDAIKPNEKSDKEIKNHDKNVGQNFIEEKEAEITPPTNVLGLQTTKPSGNSYAFVTPVVIVSGVVIGAVYFYKKWKIYKAAQEKFEQEKLLQEAVKNDQVLT